MLNGASSLLCSEAHIQGLALGDSEAWLGLLSCPKAHSQVRLSKPWRPTIFAPSGAIAVADCCLAVTRLVPAAAAASDPLLKSCFVLSPIVELVP